MTKSGDTSPAKSLLAFSRYPNTANVAYERTMTITPIVASYLRRTTPSSSCTASTTTSNGVYDGVLERSDIDRSLTGESTAPALCGPLKAGKAPPADGKSASSGTQVFTASLQLSAGSSDPPGPPALVCPIHPGFRQA